MPHLKIEYTANLDALADIGELCKTLSHTLVTLKDSGGTLVFPLLGTRVLAYPAAQYAVADGEQGRAFVYMNMRITPGRSEELVTAVGDAVLAAARAHLAPVLYKLPVRLTLHIDATPPAYEGKFSS
ncbi:MULTISPECIES: 5-carboxymethyl-2-hydroxymuconate Delta-isomerase [unclassified Duganella]|uniref:5-carboxymethyl-2-hydroxymuconate Delta-isomerase n=1 Tax=unclassified Duganella TaxID=2636909 RepID=UPI000E34686A|nr:MULTISPECIES: 5-carboxymethyl-2-hydroxymuconate Delta-isomerase [unclassified Duganella]RFP11334.1 5-carboxymethyl-2-hydroxymuconate Delta-isomerase [Duganella sp. BJB475]RFP29653.1 5-carboxymethyl-2-hydroxymuconate Delta-isomerase [Duganella sp. BJB476]